MANRGMPTYTGVGPSYGGRRIDGATGATIAAGNQHLGCRHPPVRGLHPRTAGLIAGQGVPTGSVWEQIGRKGRSATGQMWPRS